MKYEEIIALVEARINGGDWLFLVLLLSFVLFWKGRGIIEFFLQIRNQREKTLLKALKLKEISGSTRTFLEDEINHIFFKKVTGISADKYLREKIKVLCEKSKGGLQVSNFERARKHFEFKDGKIHVTLTVSAKIGFISNWLFSGIMFFSGMIIIGAGFFAPKITLIQTLGVIAIGIVYLVLSMLLISQTVPYTVAKKIKPIIDKLENEDSIQETEGELAAEAESRKTIVARKRKAKDGDSLKLVEPPTKNELGDDQSTHKKIDDQSNTGES